MTDDLTQEGKIQGYTGRLDWAFGWCMAWDEQGPVGNSDKRRTVFLFPSF